MAKRKTPKNVKATTSKLRSPKKRAPVRVAAPKARSTKSATRKPVAKVAKKVAKKAAPKVKKQAVKKAATKKTLKTAAPKAQKPAIAKVTGRVATGLRRRDGAGHLDPKYAADLRRASGRRETPGVGFLEQSRSSDDLAEAFGEQFVEAATTGEDAAEKALDEEVPEEIGGPFVRSSAGTEFAEGTDKSNPRGAKREPFPTT
jgi:hypothetical protein